VLGMNYWVLLSVIEHWGSTALIPQWFQASDHLKQVRSHQVMITLVYSEYVLIYPVPGINYWALSRVIEHQGLMASMPRWFWAPDHLKEVRSHQVMIILAYSEYILIYWVPGINHRALSRVIEHWGSTALMPQWFWASNHQKRIRSHQVKIILVYFEYILIYWELGINYQAL